MDPRSLNPIISANKYSAEQSTSTTESTHPEPKQSSPDCDSDDENPAS